MKIAKKTKAAPRARRDRSFDELILLVPYRTFVAMVGKANLTPDDSRELCRAFKGIAKS